MLNTDTFAMSQGCMQHLYVFCASYFHISFVMQLSHIPFMLHLGQWATLLPDVPHVTKIGNVQLHNENKCPGLELVQSACSK